MSLLDDVSIVVTPNGYKAGELYAVIPVPTEGAELGDTGTISNNAGGVITKTSSLNYNATSDGTSSTASKPKLDSFSLTVGKRYRITIAPSNQSGTINFDVNNDGTLLTENNDLTSNLEFDFTNGSNFRIVFDGTLTFNCDFVISLKELTSADMDVTRATAATRVDENGLVNYAEVIGGELVNCVSFDCADPAAVWSEGSGWSFSGGKAIYDGTGGTSGLIQSNVIEVGKQYKVIVEVLSNQGSGSNTLYLGGTILSSSHLSVGTHTFYGATSNTNVSLYIYGRSGEVFEIGSFSVKEVTRDNVPRIDYTGGGCPHILAEPQRTNLITYSSDFSESSWTKLGSATVIADTTISPDGTLNADSFSFTTSTSDKIQQTVTVVASQQYTVSCYIKSDSNITIKMGGAAASTPINVTTEWVRHTVIQTNGAGTTAYPQLTSNGTEGTIYVYGFQLEQGSYPTSYIPTSGSTVTRNQDIFTRDGIGSLINSTEGVLFVEVAALADEEISRDIEISDGTSLNRVVLYYHPLGGSVRFAVVSNGTLSADVDVNLDVLLNHKIACVWKENRFELWIDGYKVDEDLSGSTPATGTLNKLSFSNNAGSRNFYGKVKQLQVYDTSLSDTQLAALTSL